MDEYELYLEESEARVEKFKWLNDQKVLFVDMDRKQ
jgi:hypothetical protein